MTLKYTYYIAFACIVFITFLHNGLCVQCYSCVWDNRKMIKASKTQGVAINSNCARPFNSSGVAVQECPGVCVDATATVDVGVLGKDLISLRTCVKLSSCEEFRPALEKLAKPFHVTSFTCEDCNSSLCNAGHSLQLRKIALLLPAFFLSRRLLY